MHQFHKHNYLNAAKEEAAKTFIVDENHRKNLSTLVKARTAILRAAATECVDRRKRDEQNERNTGIVENEMASWATPSKRLKSETGCLSKNGSKLPKPLSG
jgi:septal ring factor EnvC (AmiA/AmiB activator)